MGRIVSRSSQVAIDLAVLSLAFWLAFLLRFDWSLPYEYFKRAAFTWPYMVGFQYLVLMAFGVHRFSWRYISLREVPRILMAAVVASTTLLTVRYAADNLRPTFGYSIYAIVPTGVLLIDFVVGFLGVAGVRVFRRMLAERSHSGALRGREAPSMRTLLVGAGEAGVQVAKEILARPDLGMKPVGFVDDDKVKHGTEIHGIKVLGSSENLPQLCESLHVEQVLITMASAPGSTVRRIKSLCDEVGVHTQIIPGLYEIVGGKVNLQRIRPVAIEDLLRRDTVQLDDAAVGSFIARKVVLVTGAGGSIGSELCRQVAKFSPARLLLVERFENALFEIHSELRAHHPNLALTPCIADITDHARMQRLLEQHRPDVVLHAAAHKHVPMMEWNPGEAIKNNVLGTKGLTELCAAAGVGHFVMISTDKAVNPSSVMGASKRVAELYVQGMDQRTPGTTFVSVRFGNVLGSSGSVIPIFKKQIEAGGPVCVTHPEMKRYFMTIPEATQLVLQAAAMGEGGEVFILDMGEPVKIVDLARDLILLSGLEPDKDVEIQFTGVRPGEKLFEELATDTERADKTRHHKIFVGRVQPADWDKLNRGIADLQARTDALDERQIYEALRGLIPEFQSKVGRDDGAEVISIARG
ncbi:MAG: nucleoside-diphosphate sugar epimerase/dehydratase [Pseudomonadota bacterium]